MSILFLYNSPFNVLYVSDKARYNSFCFFSSYFHGIHQNLCPYHIIESMNFLFFTQRRFQVVPPACTTFVDSEKLRNNEYYDMQEIFDDLYQKARYKQNFYKLYAIITSKCDTNIVEVCIK